MPNVPHTWPYYSKRELLPCCRKTFYWSSAVNLMGFWAQEICQDGMGASQRNRYPPDLAHTEAMLVADFLRSRRRKAKYFNRLRPFVYP